MTFETAAQLQQGTPSGPANTLHDVSWPPPSVRKGTGEGETTQYEVNGRSQGQKDEKSTQTSLVKSGGTCVGTTTSTICFHLLSFVAGIRRRKRDRFGLEPSGKGVLYPVVFRDYTSSVPVVAQSCFTGL